MENITVDYHSLTSTVVIDREELQEFTDALKDYFAAVERDVAVLKKSPKDTHAIDSLFRVIHTIKGDAALCKIGLVVALVHPAETILARVRKSEVSFSHMLAEAILLVLDRVELAVDALYSGQSLKNLRLDAMIQGFQAMENVPDTEIDLYATDLIEAVTGFRPLISNPDLRHEYSTSAQSDVTVAQSNVATAQSDAISSIDEDLLFFRSLANQFETHSQTFKGRTRRLLRLATKTNQTRGEIVPPAQLEAAIYMHDIGMMFLPESIWLKQGLITAEEREILRRHPGFSHGILSRMHGWEDAAEMVLQHHEMPDGGGYPKGLKANQICEGAKILSIVDAFESVMLKHSNQGKNRSVLRAAAVVNACSNQFSPEWIGAFNQVVHQAMGDAL